MPLGQTQRDGRRKLLERGRGERRRRLKGAGATTIAERKREEAGRKRGERVSEAAQPHLWLCPLTNSQGHRES